MAESDCHIDKRVDDIRELEGVVQGVGAQLVEAVAADEGLVAGISAPAGEGVRVAVGAGAGLVPRTGPEPLPVGIGIGSQSGRVAGEVEGV